MQFDHLREIELFQDFSELHFAHLVSLAEARHYGPEEFVFRTGESARYLYVIRKGRVRISSIMPGGGEEALAFLAEQGFFGELKLVDDSTPYGVQAVAHTECSLDLFPLRDLRDLLGTDHDLAVSFLWNMVRVLAKRMQATNDKIAAMAKLSSPV